MSLTAAAIIQYVKSKDLITENLKAEAEKLASFYDVDLLKIEINIGRESNGKSTIKMNITEFSI